jgi:hypothetical protein
MTEYAKERRALVAAVLLTGVLADLLLREAPWGVNILLWMVAFCAIAGLLVRVSGFRLSPHVAWLAPLACFFAATFAWRDSDSLKVVNGTALCCIIALAALRGRFGFLAFGSVTEYSLGLVREWLSAPIACIHEVLTLFAELRSAEQRAWGTPLAVVRGLLIALPLVLLFGGLFMNADASFEQLVRTLFDFDLSAFVRALLWLPVCILAGGGTLLRLMEDHNREDLVPERGRYGLGMVETGIVLGLLNLLFFSFIATQFGYFFGGSAMLADAPGLSAATYARRGFFELVAVTLLVLPLLLVIHWLRKDDSPGEAVLFRSLAGSLVVMLFAIMASAMHRMYLYQKTFGLTELRLYASFFMVWLGLVFLWFLKTVLLDDRGRFAFGAVVSGVAIIVLLDVLNPDALIVRVNTSRASAGKEVDIGYLFTLSKDAVPAFIGALPFVKPHQRSYYALHLVTRLQNERPDDWRSWNRGAARARQAFGIHRMELERMALSGGR